MYIAKEVQVTILVQKHDSFISFCYYCLHPIQ